MQPRSDPVAQEEPPPPFTGPDRRDVLPDNSDPADHFIARVFYEAAHGIGAARERAPIDDANWRRLLSRRDCIWRHQRQCILDHPGSIPDRPERQRWRSRLYAARPRMLAAAERLRGRRKRSNQKALKAS